MKKNHKFLILLILICGCVNQNTTLRQPTITLPSTLSPKVENITPTASVKNYLEKNAIEARDLRVIKNAYWAWWMPDGNILCKTCVLNDDTIVPWGLIDPNKDAFTPISGLDYFFSKEEVEIFTKNKDEIYKFITSPSKNHVIVELRSEDGMTNSTNNEISNHIFKILLYSRVDKNLIEIPMINIDICKGQVKDFITWSDDERYVLADCWVGETPTKILIDLQTRDFFDLRKPINNNNIVNAAISRNGKKMAIYDYENSLFIFDIDALTSAKPLAIIEVNSPFFFEWSNDGDFLYFDNLRDAGRGLDRLDSRSFEIENLLVFNNISLKDTGEKFLGWYTRWSLSPSNESILLHRIPGLWIVNIP